ncbi:outer membrane protein transport protein [Sulfurimonas sp. HSL-1716]|uniref:OmpP1/FadL family transporter n=1 Tax=Hydrocurvibacter sulfurireducens TaxID=3131937 RepID=UPI0031F7DEF4
MKKIVLSSFAAVSVLMAGGYKIPESSLNAVALSSAYVANAHGADAAYYNPANMVFSDNKDGAIEVDATYIGLSKIDFKNSAGTVDISSKPESFAVPTFHYVSPAFDEARFGFSIVSPVGLSKRWSDTPASLTANEFTLKTVEFNPSLAYKLNDKLAVAFGLRAIYSSGVVKNAGYKMDGEGFDYGYNFALTLRPDKDTNIALTYRSQIDLHISGDTFMVAAGNNGGVKVSVPVPAVISIAASHTYDNDTTVEAVFEHNVWSAYEKLDFDFSDPTADALFGSARAKNWQDTDTFRLGLTHKYKKTTAMVGFAYDPSPVPNSTLGYELPDSTGKIFSLGGRYDISDTLNVGIAGLIDVKDDRKVHNTSIDGKFTSSRAYLVTAGVEYRF